MVFTDDIDTVELIASMKISLAGRIFYSTTYCSLDCTNHTDYQAKASEYLPPFPGWDSKTKTGCPRRQDENSQNLVSGNLKSISLLHMSSLRTSERHQFLPCRQLVPKILGGRISKDSRLIIGQEIPFSAPPDVSMGVVCNSSLFRHQKLRRYQIKTLGLTENCTHACEQVR